MLENEIKIIESVEKAEYKGIGLIRLSIETNIAKSDLRVFLDSNSDFFTKIPNTQKYVLNRFGTYKGESSKMINELVTQYKKNSEKEKILFRLYVPIIVALVTYFLCTQ